MESVGSKDGIIAIMDLMIESIVGRAENVRVGKGVGIAVPLGGAERDGRIFTEGSVNPNCRPRSSACPPLSASAAVAAAIMVRSISSVSTRIFSKQVVVF